MCDLIAQGIMKKKKMKKVVLYVLLCACVRGRERENCVREKDCNNALDASYEFTEKPFGFFFDDFLSYDFFTSEFRL